MGRCKNGEAISPAGCSAAARQTLRRFLDQTQRDNNLDVWRRARGVLGYIAGRRVVDLAAELDVTRGCRSTDGCSGTKRSAWRGWSPGARRDPRRSSAWPNVTS